MPFQTVQDSVSGALQTSQLGFASQLILPDNITCTIKSQLEKKKEMIKIILSSCM